MAKNICSRRVFLKGLSLVSLGLAPFLKACDILGGQFQSTEVKMEAGPATENPGIPRPSLPPIDRAVPERTETATFALG